MLSLLNIESCVWNCLKFCHANQTKFWRKNIFEIVFKRWNWILEDYPLLCGVPVADPQVLKRQESQRGPRRGAIMVGRVVILVSNGAHRAKGSCVTGSPSAKSGQEVAPRPPTLYPDVESNKLPYSSGVPPLLCICTPPIRIIMPLLTGSPFFLSSNPS